MMFSGQQQQQQDSAAQAPTQAPGLDTVADLERKLAMLKSTENTAPQQQQAPAFAMPAAPAAASGKSALLARIMAAQDKAKKAQQPAQDLLSSVDPNAPPAFDAAALPQPTVQKPPAFDDSLLPPPAPAPTTLWEPAAPSAPDLSDLLAMEAPPPQFSAPPQQQFSAPPQQSAGLDQEAVQAILAMEGLSEADKQALLEEQMKIMAEIEQNKTHNQAEAAHNAADAFESRSFSANIQAVNNPGRRLRTGGAAATAGMSAEEAAQLKADMELAEALQKEEYAEADRQERRTARRSAPAQPTRTTAPQQQQQDSSWMGWLGFGGSSTTASKPAPAPSPGYAAPGTSSTAPRSSNQTAESDAFLQNRPRARVAESQPLFACVTDSINTALTQAIQPPPDGVDASSLLAMPQVGRESDGYQPHTN